MRLTPSGRVALLLMVGFGAAAANTATNLLYVLAGVGFNVLWVNVWWAGRALRGLEVERRASGEVAWGGSVEVEVRVSRGGLGLGLPVEVEDGWLEEASGEVGRVVVLGFEEEARGRYRVCVRRRGVWRGGSVWVRCRGPFGLVERSREVVCEAIELTVWPRVRGVRGVEGGGKAAESGVVARRVGYEEERRDWVRGLREFRAGDDPRTIHWRASARRGEYVVKEYERLEPRTTWVLVELWEGAGEGACEGALEVAAAWLLAGLSRGERVGVGVAGEGLGWSVPREGGEARAGGLRVLGRAEAGGSPARGALEGEVLELEGGARLVWVTTRAGGEGVCVTSREEAERWLRGGEEGV